MIILSMAKVIAGLYMFVSYTNSQGVSSYARVNDNYLHNNLINNVTNDSFSINFELLDTIQQYITGVSGSFQPHNDLTGGYEYTYTIYCDYRDNDIIYSDLVFDTLTFSYSFDTNYDLSFDCIYDNDYGTFNYLASYNIQSEDTLQFSNTNYLTTMQSQGDTQPFNDVAFDDTFLLYENTYTFIDESLARIIGEGYYGSDDFNTGYNQGHREGYDEGYHEGLTASDDTAYQTGYREGHADGLAEGMETGHITEIFSNIVQVGILPINVFLAMLNFEVFGINIGSFASGLLTIAIVIIIVRVVTGSSASGGGGKNGS